MRPLMLCSLVLVIACNENKPAEDQQVRDTSMQVESTPPLPLTEKSVNDSVTKLYSNARFRNVRLHKIGNDSFRITGEGQIFEASFNWIVEDGHNELDSGYATTDAGAPAWGKFAFAIRVPGRRDNSVLHLIIYETSAKDGSRQYELPMVLK